MTVGQARRSHLFDRLAGAVGEEAASTMFDLLPPADTDLATAAGLAALEGQMGAGFAHVDRRFEEIDRRFEDIDRRFEEIDRRFEAVDRRFERLEDRVDNVATAIDGLRGELVGAVNGQTRAMLLGVLTSVAGIAGLSFTFASIM
jgi:tetrahydromethanopterin S-methyltransferase subunit G